MLAWIEICSNPSPGLHLGRAELTGVMQNSHLISNEELILYGECNGIRGAEPPGRTEDGVSQTLPLLTVF